MEESRKELSDKSEAEMNEIKKNFNAAVEELVQQSEKQKDDLTKLAASKSAIETKNGQIKTAYSNLLSEKRKIETEAKLNSKQFPNFHYKKSRY